MSGDEGAAAGSTELAIAVEDDVMLVSGDQSAVDAYLAALLDQGGEVAAVSDRTLGAAGGLALSSAVGLVGTKGEYVRFSPGSLDLLHKHGAIPDGNGFFHSQVKDGHLFAGNLRWEHADLAAEQALAVQTAIASAALMLAVNEVTKAVARVEDKVEDVLVLAQAQHLGDVLGRYRFLEQRTADADRQGRISQADWDAVAGAGADVAVTVDRLRAFLTKSLEALPVEAPADERARKLERLVDGGRFAEALGLLVVAEQSLFLWHRLRLRQIQQREPDHLSEAIVASKSALNDAERLDGGLVAQLHTTLASYGAIRPLELHRRFSRRKLKEDVKTLQEALEEFAAARNAQVSSWPELQDPTLRDAVQALNSGARALGGQVQELGTEALSSAGRTFERLGRRMQREKAPLAKDGDQEGESSGLDDANPS